MSNLVALLQIMSIEGYGESRLRKLLTQMKRQGLDPAGFVMQPDSVLTGEFGLPNAGVESLRASQEPCEVIFSEFEALSDAGQRIGYTYIGLDDFPVRLQRRLAEKCPPVLFHYGHLGLCEQPGVGICGSRDASEQGCTAAKLLARQLASTGAAVISGYARGVDTAAHDGALEAEGATVIVLPTGILNFSQRSHHASEIDPASCLILSQFFPSAGWFAYSAMARNTTICGLSSAVVLVESGLEGGTWDAGNKALRYKIPAYVLEGDPEGYATGASREFMLKGASRIEQLPGGEFDITDILLDAEAGESVALPLFR